MSGAMVARRKQRRDVRAAAGIAPSTKGKTMNKTIATIRRKNGNIETVDITAKFSGMSDDFFAHLRKANAKAGQELIKIEWTYDTDNSYALEQEYKRGMLEGGDGYIPDMTKSPKYRKWTETKVFS